MAKGSKHQNIFKGKHWPVRNTSFGHLVELIMGKVKLFPQVLNNMQFETDPPILHQMSKKTQRSSFPAH
jgi:hypothetical protein